MEFSCLIIDDDTSICEILEHQLDRTSKFRSIQSCNDGNDAMRKLRNQTYDLILLDCNMPKANGLTVSKHIERNNPQNFIVISGDLDSRAMKQFIEVGIKNFLVKPFGEDALLEKVSKVLRTKLVAY